MNTDSPRIHWAIALIPFVVLVGLQVLVITVPFLPEEVNHIDGTSNTSVILPHFLQSRLFLRGSCCILSLYQGAGHAVAAMSPAAHMLYQPILLEFGEATLHGAQ